MYMNIFFVVWIFINICVLVFEFAYNYVYEEFEPLIGRIYNKAYNEQKLRLWVVCLAVIPILPAAIVDTIFFILYFIVDIIISIFCFVVKNTNVRNLFFRD